MNELTKQPVTKLAELIRRHAVSPVEVVEAYLRRIEILNPRLNAVVTLAPDALSRAQEAESQLMRGETVGPLHGVPVTVKDTIETKGLLTTSGSRRRAQHVPHEDAPAVARLKAAGAIVLGKTNVSEMAMSYDCDNPLFGRTNNPHDCTRTPGGSSGGEAAAISACLSPAGLGTDLSGSIRIPAHFCGITGLKPTTGRVPAGGQFPPAIGPFSLGAVIGPMARCVADLSLMFDVLAGFNPSEPMSVPTEPFPQAKREVDLRGWRVAWYADDGVIPVTEETRFAVETATQALVNAGLTAIERRPPGVECATRLWSALFSRMAMRHLRETYDGHEEEAGAFVRFLLESVANAAPPTPDELINAWIERDLLRASLVEWLEETPLIVAPVGAAPAFAHGARKLQINGQSISIFQAFGYAQAFNVFGLPSVCVPAGRSREGLPIGVQIVGRPFAEDAVLAAALIVEEALGGWLPPPDPPETML